MLDPELLASLGIPRRPAQSKPKDVKRAEENAEKEQIWPFTKNKPAAPAPKVPDDSKIVHAPSPYGGPVFIGDLEINEEEITKLHYHFPGKILRLGKVQRSEEVEN